MRIRKVVSIAAKAGALTIVVGLFVACGSSRAPEDLAASGGSDAGAQPVTDGGGGGGEPPAGSVGDAGAGDAGTPDFGAGDAGTPDGGSSGNDGGGVADPAGDGGTVATIDCGSAGAAMLAWKISGYQNPYNLYDASSYRATGTDTLDGVVVTHTELSGHFVGTSDATFAPDGTLRTETGATSSCHPVTGCSEVTAVIADGTIYSSTGTARSARDGHVLYTFDPVPAGADAGTYWVSQSVAARGDTAVYTWTDSQAPTSTATAVRLDGGIIWQRTFPDAIEGTAVDDSGVTLLTMARAGQLVALAPDGTRLYARPLETTLSGGVLAAGGRFYLGGRTLYDVRTGSPLPTPVVDSDLLLLTPRRMYLTNADPTSGVTRLRAVDLQSGQVVWNREIDWDSGTTNFSLTADRAVLVDPRHVLHVLESDDGKDVLACKVAPDAAGPVLLKDGRLALQRYPNLEVYDLPY